jgi:hypothetical protein
LLAIAIRFYALKAQFVVARRGKRSTWVILEFITIWVILCPLRKEVQLLLRYRDIPTHTTKVLDLTSLTVDELTALVPHFEAAFLDYMATSTLHGQRRQARRYTTYRNCPLPTLEDRLLFMLVYLKQHTIHRLHGRLSGMRQAKSTRWGIRSYPWRRYCRQPSQPPYQKRPLFVMTTPRAPSRAQQLRRNSKRALAASKSDTC